MNKYTRIQIIQSVFHQYTRVLVFAVIGVIIGAFSMNDFLVYQYIYKEKQETQEVIVAPIFSFARSAPVHLRIPKLDMNASFEAPLGLNVDNTVEVPDSYEKVGWYKFGATPGETGSAVILGHVDSYTGPAVFYALPNLQKNDEIEVEREDGTIAVFTVEELVRYSQDDFPTERVYGKTETATLRLVTCTGNFDKGKQRYSHNLVVYATLKE